MDNDTILSIIWM